MAIVHDYVSLLFILFLLFATIQAFDPLKDFCRHFAHQTTVIDRKLYIDGGLMNFGDDLSYNNGENYTSTWLLYLDLDEIVQGFPNASATPSKRSDVPMVQGGTLWADPVNKLFYLYGGEYHDASPQPFGLWAYDTIYNTWNETSSDTSGILRASFGAGAVAEDSGLGFYYGGWLSNASVPGWNSEPKALAKLVTYDMVRNTWKNASGPDSIPRAEGVMLYLPASDRGMLVYFGGIQIPETLANDSWIGQPMNIIHIYDIASEKWYTQNATGQVPGMRRRFCAGITWAEDQSSYNIYIYGGMSMPPNMTGFDDAYILSMPSFTWVKYYPADDTEGYPHHSMSCNVIDGSQMIVMGGSFPTSDQCDVPTIWGQHNMNLGRENVDNAQWYQFLPNLTTYQVPSDVRGIVGGDSTGRATSTAPSGGWEDNDLSVYFGRSNSAGTRTPTRSIPSSNTASSTSIQTQSPTTQKKQSDVGAIAGGAVGGSVVLVAFVAGMCFCLRRRAKREHAGDISQPPMYTPPMSTYTEAPAELAVSPHNISQSHEPSKPQAVVPANGTIQRWPPRSQRLPELDTNVADASPLSAEPLSQEMPTNRSPVGTNYERY